jgi:hypothetical protein
MLIAALCVAGLPDVQAQLSIGLTATEYHGGLFQVSEHGAMDGGATSTVSGGMAPYSYAWKRLEGAIGYSAMGTSEHLSGVGGGLYRLVVTDSLGAVDSASVMLTEPGPLMVMPQVMHLTCAGMTNGSATLMVTGGVAPYTYAWSNSDTLSSTTGLGAGQHHVTVTSAGGAQRTEHFTVNAPMPVGADIMQMGWPLCHGDTVTMHASAWGGAPPYTYHWSTGAFSSQLKTVQGGQYSVQVTDMNNCHATDSISVSMPQALTATINYLPYANGTPFSCDTCNDGIMQVTPLGGVMPYTTVWSTGHMGTVLNGMYADSAYHVTVTDMQGCMWQSDTLTAQRGVAFAQSLGVFLFAHQYAGGHHVSHAGAMDGSIEAVTVGGTPPYALLWNTGDTIAELDSLGAGYYTVTVTDQNGAQRTRSKTLTAPMPLSVSMTGGLGGCMAVGNQLNAFANGGAPPYTYVWHRNDTVYDSTHNFPYLQIHQAGTYRVDVADANSDTVSTQTVLTPPVPLTTVLTATEVQPGYHATCHGDTVQLTLTVSGGSGPLMFMWEHGSFQQHPKVTSGGLKVVRVNDMQGCTAVDSIYINMPMQLENRIHPHVYANGQAFSCDTCNDGMFVLDSIWGGVAPYAHQWSNGSTGDTLHGIIPDTVYSITMTDAMGCTKTDGGSLPRTWNPEPPGLALMFDKSFYPGGYHVSCVACADGHIQLWPSGGTPPYTYQWMDGDSTQHRYGLMAGMYGVTVTDAHGLSLWREFTLVGPGGGLNVHISNNATSCRGMVSGSLYASVMGGVPPYGLQWRRDGMPLPDMWNHLSVWQGGHYAVTVTDATGQTATDSVMVGMGAELTLMVTALEKYGSAHTGCTVRDGELTLQMSGGTPPYQIGILGGLTRQMEAPAAAAMAGGGPIWLSTMDTVAVMDSLGAGLYSITVNDMSGCHMQQEVELRGPGTYVVTATPVELLGGHYASCDTCSDVTVNAAALGAWGDVQYVWAEVPAEQAPMRLRGASLSMSEDGRNVDSALFSGTHPSVFGAGAQQTGLATETMYVVATMDALGCMGQAMFTVERPPSTGSGQAPAWGLYGNPSAGSGQASNPEDEPWLGTSDSTDVVMKANGVPQLRLGADGVIEISGQLKAPSIDEADTTFLASAKALVISPDGSFKRMGLSELVERPVDGPCARGINPDGTTFHVPAWVNGPGKIWTAAPCPANVGIGTSDPISTLDVRGLVNAHHLRVNASQDGSATKVVIKGASQPDNKALEVQGTDGNPALRVYNSGLLLGGADALRVHPDDAVTVGPYLTQTSAPARLYLGDDRNHSVRAYWGQGLRFGTYGVDNAMLIEDVTGKVGIGVGANHTFGEGLLEVNGTIRSHRLVTELANWPDYVFSEGYTLMPLTELRRFIDEHGRLPDIPSAAEMEQSGLDHGELIRLQMQKIEELTRYVLELEQRLNKKCGE